MLIIEQIKHLLATLDISQFATWGVWSYMLLAVLVAIEGPIATLLGAAASAIGLMHPGFVFLAASTGNLTSDTLWYTLGYVGKIDWIKRIGQRIGISMERLERLERMLQEHAPIILFFSKLTVSPMIPALIATGLIKYPWKRWFPYVFAGEMIWTGSLVLIGYFGVQAIKKVQLGIEHVILAGSVIFIICLLWFGRKFLRKESQNPTQSSSVQGEEKE